MSRGGGGAKSALEILEEALLCLRREPGLLAGYYLGTLPFVLGFLTFWGEMSRSGSAARQCAPFALGLALLFAWMKLWHATFARGVLELRVGGRAAPLSLRRAVSLLAVQTPLQATGMIVLPAAAVLVLPFGWAYAFYQHAALDGAETRGLRAAFGRAWREALREPRQNHVLLFLMAALGHFALLNVAATLVLLPFLLKGVLGVESPFTRTPWAFASTTFLAAVGGVTYLCVDPLSKAAYALRHFYSEAEASGADLRADLRAATEEARSLQDRPGRRARGRAPILLLLVVATASFSPPARSAERAPALLAEPASLPPDDLDRAITQVLQRSEYAWRVPPRPADEAPETGFLARFRREAGALLSSGLDAAVEAIRTVLGWLSGLLPRGERPARPAPSWEAGWIKGLLMAALAGVAGVLILLLARRRAIKAAPGAIQARTATPDLEDDAVAEALAPDGWEALARELLRLGRPRLAVRALYLGSLAQLARSRLLTLARHKSNRDYAEELARRVGDGSGVLPAFAENVRLFEQIWYGRHLVTEDALHRFRENFGKILAHGG